MSLTDEDKAFLAKFDQESAEKVKNGDLDPVAELISRIVAPYLGMAILEAMEVSAPPNAPQTVIRVVSEAMVMGAARGFAESSLDTGTDEEETPMPELFQVAFEQARKIAIQIMAEKLASLSAEDATDLTLENFFPAPKPEGIN